MNIANVINIVVNIKSFLNMDINKIDASSPNSLDISTKRAL